MWAQVRKFAPLAAVVGYAAVYMNKGWDKVLTDLKGITVDKITAKWQNIAIAVVAGVAIYMLGRVKMPAAFKALVLLFLYIIIGYNVATVIDPVNGSGYSRDIVSSYVRPAARNPYSYSSKGV